MSDLTLMQHLEDMLAAGAFHHATYRNVGSLWEGLYIYRKDEEFGRGFRLDLVFPAGDEDEAYELIRHTGVSLGSYGEG